MSLDLFWRFLGRVHTYTHTNTRAHGCHVCAGIKWLQRIPAERSEGWQTVLAATKVMHVAHEGTANKKS